MNGNGDPAFLHSGEERLRRLPASAASGRQRLYRRQKRVDFLEGGGVAHAGPHHTPAQGAQYGVGSGGAVQSAPHGKAGPVQRVRRLRGCLLYTSP